MRDKNRIRPFLNKIAEEWENHPDLRFGQFVMDVIAAAIVQTMKIVLAIVKIVIANKKLL